MLLKVLFLHFVLANCENILLDSIPALDYGWLAENAESQKSNILGFLNKTRVKQEYKLMYYSLLSRLTGVRSVELTGSTRRIVYGQNTSISSVPWQVSIRDRVYPICGGTILTEIWIISAAHCLLRHLVANLSIRLGSSWKSHGGEMYDVKERLVHPSYLSSSKANDVGLLRLYSPLRFTNKILPLKLIEREKRLLANKLAVVSGWGKIKEGGPSATYLQSSPIRTIPMKLCKRSALNRKAIDPASMFCAGSFIQSSPDACQGDSGGPVALEGELIGVVSWGLGCARGNFPGVYTRLSHPAIWDWVYNHISSSNNTRPRIGDSELDV